jgi:uncharacterized protein YoxC
MTEIGVLVIAITAVLMVVIILRNNNKKSKEELDNYNEAIEKFNENEGINPNSDKQENYEDDDVERLASLYEDEDSDTTDRERY